MACRAIHSWSLCALVGAYLDLALAYLLLCGSTLAFLASKFLALFGLALPCSCDGLFGHPGAPCLQRLLVAAPVGTIASVHMSVRSRFPFDSIWSEHPGSSTSRCFEVELVRDGRDNEDIGGRGLLEMGGEESCGSVPSVRHIPSSLILPSPPPWDKRVGLDSEPSHGSREAKGKGVLVGQRPRSVLRRRRRRGCCAAGKFPSSVSSSQPPPFLLWQAEGIPDAPCSASQAQMFEYSFAPVCSDPCNAIEFDKGAPSPIELPGLRLDYNAPGKVALSNIREVTTSEENLADTVRKLQLALQEERAAHAALYLELEQERSAAATATDEAMAMILRLQKEKAAIEMEAWQYQRMIEEKSAYDEEEMEILKEIIVRREREKHVLEKEVEAYRQMVFSGEQVEQQVDGHHHDKVQLMGQNPGASFDSSDEPVLMLQQMCKSIGEKEKEDDGPLVSIDFKNEALLYGDVKQDHCIQNHPLELLDSGDESNVEFQEKSMVTMDVSMSSVHSQRSTYEETSHLIEEGSEKERKSKITMSVAYDDLYSVHSQDADRRGSDSCRFDIESNVHDVHVVDDKFNMGTGTNGKEGHCSETGCASYIFEKGCSSLESSGIRNHDPLKDFSDMNWAGEEQNICRSCSEIRKGSLMDCLCDKASLFDLRRSSTSAVENERCKLETEVELLRKRLKIIHEGREKLAFSTEHMEKESFQLQLLEEIACQLREIRKMTESGKSVRQASLPPSSSKVKSKKRRCRSVPWELHESM